MKPETTAYFTTAGKLMANAAKLYDLGFYEDAARNCYLAGMNAARGLLFEDDFQVTKRHKSLFGALSQALHARGIHDINLTAFLPTMVNLKAIADYETGDSSIDAERAADAIQQAKQFLDSILTIAKIPRPST